MQDPQGQVALYTFDGTSFGPWVPPPAAEATIAHQPTGTPEEWNLTTLEQFQVKQVLSPKLVSDGLRTYHWRQDGVDQTPDGLYGSRGTKLFAMPDLPNAGQVLREVASYTNNQIQWDDGHVWTRVGPPVQLPAAELRWQPGQNSVLYLHFENLLMPENSRGPRPGANTCGAKLSIDPTLAVNHVQISRSHRWIEIPPGTISNITFSLRLPNGTLIDLQALGINVSFVLTIAPRGT